eukprot:CAMPEP_0176474318 /NCGR_PEP_ID=MMETSP0127-20121128/42916_1 /TAXON_ID=938130 /ORGANISM="Platyophrya macrostoma, Strain WH" /LENGTH=129 /DNA_ID=CAMNT_0017869653 /DNA_START=35 /DNA_END=424 /DNA_ORIENTATION=-
MPKKKSLKRKKKGKKKKKEYIYNYSIPAYEDPEICTPKVTVKIALVSPAFKELSMKVELPINTRLEYIKKLVVANHKGAVSDLFFVKDKNFPEEILDMSKKLDDCGIELLPEINLYYDFKPVTHPTLFS